jgi:gliding motility-associated-like protein
VTHWSRNGSTVTNPAAVAIAGSYRLVVTDPAGCSDTALVQLDVNPAPDLGVDALYSLCPWQTVDLGAVFPVAGLSTSYTLDGQPIADPSTVHDAGEYTVTVMDDNGCVDSAAVHVLNVECLCEADMSVDARCIQDPARFKLLADSIVLGVQWDFGEAAIASVEREPVVKFQEEAEVLVTMEATLACGVVRVERIIDLDDCADSCSVFIPNAFTPNGDGMNEAWSWRGECQPEDFFMRVFDRQGEEVFSTVDPNDHWDGTYAGEPAPPGVYVFRGGFRLPYQKRQEVKGAVTLLR